MPYRNDISVERVRELLSYEPDTGLFRWRKRRSGQPGPGSVAGNAKGTSGGYFKIRVDGHPYMAHRLAWLYMTGEWPKSELDHADLNKANNQWSNLREATHRQNMANSLRLKGVSKGVHRTRNGRRWHAQISVLGKTVYLGTFDTETEAHAAYCAAAHKEHGEFFRAA